YEGIEEMLIRLKENGKIVALATSKPQCMAEEVLRYFKIEQYFDIVTGALLTEQRTKKAEVIEEVFNLAGITKDSKDSVVMIGDRSYDMIGAKLMGIDGIGVTYGFGTKRELLDNGAVCTADSPTELLKLLNCF
ncbi:MAG: HAD hydrolase-like protein, partial [Eubacterium sp.]